MEEQRQQQDSGERTLRQVMGCIPDGILVLDSVGTVKYANPAAERLLGFPPGGLEGREFGYPACAGETAEIDIAVHGGTRLAEMRVVETEWEGAFAVVADLRDVTDRRRAEAEVRESEARYRQVFENAFTGNFISSPAGELLACNQAFLRIFGFESFEQAKSKNVERLYADPAQRRDVIARLRLHKSLRSLEVEMRRADGKPVHIIENLYAAFDAAGELESITGYQLDVSERKSLEEQLRHAQKMEAVGRLAGGLAHDFNNLLTVIAGRASIALEGVPGQVRDDLEEILGAAERAAAITARLLTFSRRQFSRAVDIPVGPFLRGLDRLLRSAAGDDVRLHILADQSAGVIRADQSQIEQVLLNLVVNARDAMPEGGSVSIQASGVELAEAFEASQVGLEPGNYTVLTVSDTGHGITEEVRQHLFEPFFTTKEPGRGTGLGLSTVYGIVRQCGGAIAVESEPGKGATFRAYLPQVRGAMETPAPAAEAGVCAGGSETVLVVDDETAVRKLTAAILAKKGYRVIEAADAVEALGAARENAIDLLVTDIVMPEMNGRELAGALRQLRPGLPVLFISGFDRDAFRRKETPAEDEVFLSKPFTPEALSRRAREALDGGRKG